MSETIDFSMMKVVVVSETTKQTEKETTTTYSYTFRRAIKGALPVEVVIKSEVELDLARGEIRDLAVKASAQQKLE